MPIHRRAFLGALAVAPAALAGCAGGAASSSRAGGDALPARGSGAPAAPAVAAVRAFPLPAEAEPALVFRAAAASPGEP